MFLPQEFLQGIFLQLYGFYFLIPYYIAKTKHYFKVGWCNMYPRL